MEPENAGRDEQAVTGGRVCKFGLVISAYGRAPIPADLVSPLLAGSALPRRTVSQAVRRAERGSSAADVVTLRAVGQVAGEVEVVAMLELGVANASGRCAPAASL